MGGGGVRNPACGGAGGGINGTCILVVPNGAVNPLPAGLVGGAGSISLPSPAEPLMTCWCSCWNAALR